MPHSITELKAEIFKALGHPTRLAMVEALGTEGEKCVCELLDLVGGGDRTTISKHLGVLKAAGIVSDRKEGLKVFYRLNYPCLVHVAQCIEEALRERLREQHAALGL